jgi:O-antigen/teichoic acid export membrane protein
MIKGNTIFSMGRSLLGALQNILISIIVIHFSSITNWGEFVSSYLIWSILVLLINGGSKDFIIKSVSLNPGDYWLIISNNLSLRFILSLFSLWAIVFIPFSSPLEKWLVMLIILLRAFTFSFEAMVVYAQNFKQSLVIELFSFIAVILLIISGSYFNCLQPKHIILFMILGELMKLISFNKLFLLSKNFQLQSIAVLQNLKELSPFIGLSLIGLIINKADLYVFGLLIDSKELIGQYHILNSLNNILIVIVSSFLALRNKVLFRVALGKIRSIQLAYLFYAILSSIILTGTFYMVSPFFFKFNLTLVQLAIIVFTTLFFSGTQIYIYLLMRVNKMKYIHFILLLTGILNIFLSMLFIPNYHINGALGSVLISYILAFILFHITTKKHLN